MLASFSSLFCLLATLPRVADTFPPPGEIVRRRSSARSNRSLNSSFIPINKPVLGPLRATPSNTVNHFRFARGLWNKRGDTRASKDQHYLTLVYLSIPIYLFKCHVCSNSKYPINRGGQICEKARRSQVSCTCLPGITVQYLVLLAYAHITNQLANASVAWVLRPHER